MIPAILNWYQANQRSFPWRATPPNPYFVYVSEIMLQQTTTTTVINYFNRFIKKFPTIQALAQADLDTILVLWQGLGYYNRAKNLHKTAQIIVKEYNGKIPSNKNELLQLPGIGDYTASAICAIAFNQNELPIDGNIKRIMSRFYGIQSEDKKTMKAKFLDFHNQAGDFCQGLMDFANIICKPQNPLCTQCPINKGCLKNFSLPIENKLKRKTLFTKAYIILSNDSILLGKNHNKGLLPNLWTVPLEEFSKTPTTTNNLSYCGYVKHIFTHIDLNVDIYQIPDTLYAHKNYKEIKWVTLETINQYALSTLAHKIIKIVTAQKLTPLETTTQNTYNPTYNM